jgi:hypothetical protein
MEEPSNLMTGRALQAGLNRQGIMCLVARQAGHISRCCLMQSLLLNTCELMSYVPVACQACRV